MEEPSGHSRWEEHRCQNVAMIEVKSTARGRVQQSENVASATWAEAAAERRRGVRREISWASSPSKCLVGHLLRNAHMGPGVQRPSARTGGCTVS